MSDNELWGIIDELNWKGVCDKTRKRPYDEVGKKLAAEYPELILKLKEFSTGEKFKIKEFLTTHNIRTGNDSGWDLTAHIIGCGKDYTKEVKEKVISGEYTDSNIFNEIPYVENFEYSFSVAFEELIGSNDKDKYREWLRDFKINSITQ